MSSPDFSAVRNEISDLFDSMVGDSIAENIAYMPLALSGKSPVVSTEDAGWRSLLAAMNPGQFDLAYRVMVRVNREAHGAARAADVFDDVRQAIIEKVTDLTLSFTNFAALEIPNGQPAPTYIEIHDGLQYLVGEIPVVAIEVNC
ncbi:MAG TPA: hypothetical protein EYH05_04060 [Anaerolineae bacterium]|nr:hypothetical protein [Anaerolineae bacterium]